MPYSIFSFNSASVLVTMTLSNKLINFKHFTSILVWNLWFKNPTYRLKVNYLISSKFIQISKPNLDALRFDSWDCPLLMDHHLVEDTEWRSWWQVFQKTDMSQNRDFEFWSFHTKLIWVCHPLTKHRKSILLFLHSEATQYRYVYYPYR